jgi:hypothetical protein
MHGFALRATDGEIGSVDNFLFDDTHWAIRYLVANTGGWLYGRLVLISPIAFRSLAWHDRRVDLDLTCEQIERSPGIETDKPVSRQKEEELFRYYGYPYYWLGMGMWGVGMYPTIASMSVGEPIGAPATRPPAGVQPQSDSHLRSAREVTRYAIQARDGEIGHVVDFLADDTTWAIRHIVVDTRNWWPGKRVLMEPESIDLVIWEQARVVVKLTREEIRQRPEYG